MFRCCAAAPAASASIKPTTITAAATSAPTPAQSLTATSFIRPPPPTICETRHCLYPCEFPRKRVAIGGLTRSESRIARARSIWSLRLLGVSRSARRRCRSDAHARPRTSLRRCCWPIEPGGERPECAQPSMRPAIAFVAQRDVELTSGLATEECRRGGSSRERFVTNALVTTRPTGRSRCAQSERANRLAGRRRSPSITAHAPISQSATAAAVSSCRS